MNEKFTPDQKINYGIYSLCAFFGMWLVLFLGAVGIVPVPLKYDFLIGAGGGLLVGWVICRFKPRHGSEEGIWRSLNEFLLTQMDFESAFSRKKKTQPPVEHAVDTSTRP